VKKAFFPLLTLVFIIACAVFVYLAREAEPVYVSVVVPVAETDVRADDPVRPSADRSAGERNEAALVNINTASLEELMTLQGIGPAIGQRIIDYRENSGAFMAIEEITEVSGIGEQTFENIRAEITID
jgi:comEA protein